MTDTAATHVSPVRVAGLSVRFGGLRALDDVSLTVSAGELLAVAGENGAGKSTLLRCLGGDLAPSAGSVRVTPPRTGGTASAPHVATLWQHPELCGNLDVATNLFLGRERSRLLDSEARLHATARRLLGALNIPISDTTRPVRSLTSAEQHLLAFARAVGDDPSVLLLDEPTGSLGASDSARVESLIARAHARGATVVMATHDVEQMFRLADRIVVLRRGRLIAALRPELAHPDDVLALMAGQQVDTSARRQLTRLHGLADQLTSADSSSSLSLILSALGAALGAPALCIHLADEGSLRMAASLGLDRPWLAEVAAPLPRTGGPIARALGTEGPVIDVVPIPGTGERDHRAAQAVWAVPVVGSDGPLGVITVLPRISRRPAADEIELITLYAGYAASAVQREQSERARQEAAALRRSQDLQRQFLSRLSHELRTPLTAIRGYASSLTMPDVSWDGESQRRFVERIGAESGRLGRLVGDLLDFSAIESGVLRLQPDWCDLPLVLEAARSCLTAVGQDAPALVRLVCPPGLPAVWADHDRLEQVFLNLMDNALRHNPPGTRVEVTVTCEGASVRIAVADDGSGLTDSVDIFEPRRASGGPSAGSGLGLSIAKGIVLAHGGRIELKPRTRGTLFVVTLPVERPADDRPSLNGMAIDA